eukprot:14471479-Alexandrium_andersonii.AAC.1
MHQQASSLLFADMAAGVARACRCTWVCRARTLSVQAVACPSRRATVDMHSVFDAQRARATNARVRMCV